MPRLFRIILPFAVVCPLAWAADFPVGQLIRSDVQDLYNPQTRFGGSYGNFQNDVQASAPAQPASNPNSGVGAPVAATVAASKQKAPAAPAAVPNKEGANKDKDLKKKK